MLVIIAKTSETGHVAVTNLARAGEAIDVGTLTPIVVLLYEFMYINILLGIFNLIPVPPLDGSHVLRHFLSGPLLRAYDQLGMIGLVLLFVFGGGLLGALMLPVVRLFRGILASV
jgi:Zn-dependent protease